MSIDGNDLPYTCDFLYDPGVTAVLPKYKIILSYNKIIIKTLGCNILIRSDLDKVVLFYMLRDSKQFKRELDDYCLDIFKQNNSFLKMTFNNNKYLFEVK